MNLRGTKAQMASLLSSILILSACTSDAGNDDSNAGPDVTDTAATGQGQGGGETEQSDPCLTDVGITETADGEVSVTVGAGKWSAFNVLTASTYSTYNSAIADQLFQNFWYFGTDGTICQNEEFGTYEKVSDDPLTVEYTISDEAVWSDGTPVTVNDFLLDWAAQNPDFIDDNGESDPVFNHVDSSLADYVPQGPQGEVDGKEFTLEFNEPNPDWELLITSPLPSHIAARKGGLEPQELAQAILDRDKDTVTKVAEFWNTGWIFEPGQLPDMADIPVNGPYMIKEGGWQADTALTLTANDKFGGTPPATKDLIFRFIEDASMVQALQNGDVDVIYPQATVDTSAQLENSGLPLERSSLLTWEHLDFNFREAGTIETVDDAGQPTGETVEYPGSIFSDGQGGLALREAFAMCVPRQTIVDTLIKPINPDATVMNAREVFPFQDNYDEVVGAAYDGRYDQVDIEGAKKKIEESGVETPVKVRIGYLSGNQRRTETVAAIQASCREAGFEVEDINSGTFFEKELANGDYDVALFAWSGSGQIASGQNIYATDKPQNFHKYSNETVDQAWDTLAGSLDESVHTEQIKIIEKELWDTLHGIPLYAHPGLSSHDPNLENFRITSTQAGPSWNAFQWKIK